MAFASAAPADDGISLKFFPGRRRPDGQLPGPANQFRGTAQRPAKPNP